LRGIGGEVGSGFTLEECMNVFANKKTYEDKKKNAKLSPEQVKKLVYQENKDDVNSFYSEKVHEHCKPWIGNLKKKKIDPKCLRAMWESTGCTPEKIERNKWNQNEPFHREYQDYIYWNAIGCGKKGINHDNKEKLNDAENQINKTLDLSLNTVNSNNGVIGDIQKRVIKNLKNIKNKFVDQTIAETEIKEQFSNGNGIIQNNLEQTKKYNNFNLYLLEIVNGYKDARISGKSEGDASDVLKSTYQTFKKNNTVSSIIGPQNMEAFEQAMLDHTGVDVNKTTGYDVDEEWNVREHQHHNQLFY
jgi:hypothetical protein